MTTETIVSPANESVAPDLYRCSRCRREVRTTRSTKAAVGMVRCPDCGDVMTYQQQQAPRPCKVFILSRSAAPGSRGRLICETPDAAEAERRASFARSMGWNAWVVK